MTADGAGHLFGGTTETKGGFGTIFRINDGTTGERALGFSTVHVFSGDADGRYLGAEMILDPASGAFYGVSDNEGTGPNNGTVFKLDPGFDVLTVLHTFPIGTKDGARPVAGLDPRMGVGPTTERPIRAAIGKGRHTQDDAALGLLRRIPRGVM